MAQTANISVKPRSELGSRANKRLRDNGLIPGVIYGHKEAVVPITLPKKETVNHLKHGAHVFDLAIDGKSEKVLVKEVQYDHLGNEVLHVDFARVSLDEKVEVTVPIELKGEPKGDADGGVLQQIMAEIEIECLVTEIPDIIRHNVSEMALNDVLHVKDLKLPAGVKPLADGEQIVAQVKEVKEEETAVTAAVEGEAEPEVIGKKKEDETPAEGAAAPADEKK
jgi:large subunit ribosomal protein L25